MSYKKVIVGIIIISFSVFFVPQKSYAQYIDPAQFVKEFALDTIAVVIGKIMLKKLTSQTVNWINSGFQGNPAYVTDPGQFFLDVGDNTAAKYLSETQLNKLCSPFKANVRLALVKNYIEDTNNYSCTLGTLEQNYEAFTNDFTQGGWDGWFQMTQTSGGNPYSAYFAAESTLLAGINDQKTKKETELSQGDGFLSAQKCKAGTAFTQADVDYWGEMGIWVDIGECFEEDKETVTPGSTINKSLGDALGSGWKQLEAADELNEVVTALVTQLIQRVVGGVGDGLRGASKSSATGGTSYTDQLRDEPQPDPVNPGELQLSETTMVCLEFTEGACTKWGVNPGQISGPPWLPPIDVETPTPTKPAECLQKNGNYAGDLMGAMNTVLSANPTLAGSPNTTANSFAFLALVAQNPPSGFNVTDQVLNGNDNTNRGDLLAIWKNGDSKMERYDVIASSGEGDRTISGGGKGCHCEYAPTEPLPPEPTKENPSVTSINPNPIMVWNTLEITGKNLTTVVQFIDSAGTKNTEVGQGGGTKTTILVPKYLKPGNYTVKIYKSADSISNGVPLVIKGKTEPTIPTIPTTSKWTPPQTNGFGWWAKLSPDGKYVTYGNGESWVTNLETKQSWDLKKAIVGLPATAGCYAGQWMSNTVISIKCDDDPTSKEDKSYRYEVTVGEWIPRKTSDSSNLVASNWMVVADGHWTGFLASSGRIVQDNKVIISGVGGAISASKNKIVHACDNTNKEICIRNNDGTLYKKYSVKTPNHGTATLDEYVAYGGYGLVRGITPLGTDINLTVVPWNNEGVGPGGLFYVGNALWVATVSWDNDTGNGFALLRPWGDMRALAVVADAVDVSVAIRGNDFVIAYFSDIGKLEVVTVPTNSERKTLN